MKWHYTPPVIARLTVQFPSGNIDIISMTYNNSNGFSYLKWKSATNIPGNIVYITS